MDAIKKFNKEFQAQIEAIDEEVGAEDTKLPGQKELKKCSIYQKWNNALKDVSIELLKTIEQLNKKLLEKSSDSSDLEVETKPNRTENQQINESGNEVLHLRKLIKGIALRSKAAFNVLKEIEISYNALNHERQQTTSLKDNVILNSKDKNIANKRTNSDVKDATKVIYHQIQAENEELKQTIAANERTINLITKRSVGEFNNQHHQMEQLKKEILKKDQEILNVSQNLKNHKKMLNTLKIQYYADKNKSTLIDTNEIVVHRSKLKTLLNDEKEKLVKNQESYDGNLTDSEQTDGQKIKLLEEGVRAMGSLVKKKHEMLRRQQRDIQQLQDQLEKTSDCTETNDHLQQKIKILETENINITQEYNQLRHNIQDFEELQNQISKWISDQKQRDLILNKTVVLQDGHITTLLEERQYLLETNNALLNSISVCQHEFLKHTTSSR